MFFHTVGSGIGILTNMLSSGLVPALENAVVQPIIKKENLDCSLQRQTNILENLGTFLHAHDTYIKKVHTKNRIINKYNFLNLLYLFIYF